MNTQSDKKRKNQIIAIFLGLFFLLAGGAGLAGVRFGDEVVAPAILFLFALCFSAIAAWSRKNTWAMLPAGLFASIGLVVTLESLIQPSEVTGKPFHLDVLYPKMEIPIPLGDLPGSVFMFLFAATFLGFASLSKKHWWAIIPGGLFASIGLVVALDSIVPHAGYSVPGMINWGYYTWVLFLGLAATFGILWLLRKTRPTRWAIYPAGGFLAMAVLFVIEGTHFSEYWLVTTLLVCGVTLLLGVLTSKRPDAGQQVTGIKA